MNAQSEIKTLRKNGHFHSDADVKSRGEVFTPDKLVNEMLDKLPPEVFEDKNKTFLDNSCGHGAFLFAVMYRKMMSMCKGGIPLFKAHKQALSTIYGVELDEKNAEECRLRLLKGSTSKELRDIVDNNIICADGLDQHHEGWSKVGFYWEENVKPDPNVIAARSKAKEIEASKPKTLEEPTQTLSETKKVVTKKNHIAKQFPLPLENKTTIISPIPIISTISANEFWKRMQGKIERDEEF